MFIGQRERRQGRGRSVGDLLPPSDQPFTDRQTQGGEPRQACFRGHPTGASR